MTKICVVIPAFNEAENLEHLIPLTVKELKNLDTEGQILVVDDGSTDTTDSVMAKLCLQYSCVGYDRLRRNRGKAVALKRGIQGALNIGASIIVMMDADGQDDPVELPRLINQLETGFDLVTGARLERKDRLIKRHTSRLYNRATAMLSSTPGRDFNSGFKVFTAEVARDILPMLYGELHRYITVIAHWLGYRITEVPVVHHERMHGKTKYGINRFWRGFLDLFTVWFIMSYEFRPSHLFGGIGFMVALFGSGALGYLTVLWCFGEHIGGRPLLIAGVLFIIVGLLLVLFGLLAELIVYTRQRDLNKYESP